MLHMHHQQLNPFLCYVIGRIVDDGYDDGGDHHDGADDDDHHQHHQQLFNISIIWSVKMQEL